jgi:F0F1-type ATP synthase assembly protein I
MAIKRLNLSQESDTPSRNRQQSLRLAAIGIEFFSTILGLVILGYFLDEYLHTRPVLGASGLLLGMILGVYRLTVGLRRLD